MKKVTYLLSQLITIGVLASPVFADGMPDASAQPVKKKPVKKRTHTPVHHTTAAVAPIAPAEVYVSTPYTGWYAGGQLGYAYTITDFPCVTNATGVRSFDRHNTNGIVGGIHAGYGYQFTNCWYLALELAGNLYSNKDHLNGDGSDYYRHRITNSIAINPRIGYVFQGCGLAYAKLGVEFTRWKHSIDHLNENLTGSTTKRKAGFAPGLGFSYLLCNNVILGLEGSYVWYSKKSHITNLRGENHSFKDRAADFKFRASYKW